MEKDTLKYIPNWTRFIEKYEPNAGFIEAFESRIESIAELDTYEKIAKYINIELGVLLLREREIGSETLHEIFSFLTSRED